LYRVTDVISVLLHATRCAFIILGTVDSNSLLFLHLGLLSIRGILHLIQTLGQTPFLKSTYGKFR
jgi:hypothetical protein